MGRYDGKRALITGGGSGLGLATARLLAGEGAHVIITGRTQDTLDKARAEIGGDVTAVRSDSASRSDIEALAAFVDADGGPLDGLFVNAGINGFASFEETPEEMYDRLFAINAKGPYFTVQRLVPALAPGSGVVFTTSVINRMGYPLTSVYSATKAALRSMTRTMARELLPRGVRVNAVSPGPIDTGILDRSLPAEVAAQTKAQMTAEVPMLRFGEPAEVARAAAFLAFDATFTTGSELAVDGGGSQL
ncbi:SDR family oxidoreductase [Catenuloplanes sp. NPDC051500]|uniref:SDR family oxidoreductase n=1 Tax=Catenuloplanes sp. NPDC051500 TaxID=3363959 RepID=UPI0037ABFE51